MDFKSVILCGSVLLLMTPLSVEKRLIPRRLQRIMARVSSVDSFLREMNRRKGDKEDLNRTRTEQEGPLVELENQVCAPRPVVVAVPQPELQGLHFPFYVTLHRCGGACQERPLTTRCIASDEQLLNVMVYTVSWSSARQKVRDMKKGILAVGMVNHTSCTCQCITQPSDCSPIQEFDEKNCHCVCKNRRRECPPNFSWDHSKCQCRCNLQEDFCPTRHQLDVESCGCICSTKKCRWGKLRNPKNCRCYCSKDLKPCPGGTERDPRDCRCKFGSRRLQSGQFRGRAEDVEGRE